MDLNQISQTISLLQQQLEFEEKEFDKVVKDAKSQHQKNILVKRIAATKAELQKTISEYEMRFKKGIEQFERHTSEF